MSAGADMEFDDHDGPEGSLDIAVVGMAARLPGARDVEEYWANLTQGLCARSGLSAPRAASRDRGAEDRPTAEVVSAGYLLDGADEFDARFFGYSPREAELMDPQHRLLLQCAWETLERAGCDPRRFDGLVGVYASAGFNTYLLSDVAPQGSAAAILDDKQVGIGNRHDFLATKISYKLGLRGPSVNIQSDGSSSLVAVVQACQALLGYQCDLALAGAAEIDPGRWEGYHRAPGDGHSPDGFCRTFDRRAAGSAPGNGVAMVALKRLDDAIADGDHIHAVIRGGAVNFDGSRPVGRSAASVTAQTDVVTMALAAADASPASVRYVEAHGATTVLGDSLELSALSAAFASAPRRHSIVGSVKPNIGNLGCAAGVAGLIKTALMVERGLVPPSLNFEHPNPQIDFDNGPFRVVTELSPWPQDGQPRRAAVSSFGLGGTNAHVVLEQPPVRRSGAAPGATADEQLLVLSARTPAALATATDRLRAHLRAHPGACLADVAFTLREGRQMFAHRRAVVCGSVQEASEALGDPEDSRVLTAQASTAAEQPVAFMFAGVGGQFPGMAGDLYRREPVFTAAFDRCAGLLEPLLGQDIRPLVFTPDAASQGTTGPDLLFGRFEQPEHPLHRPLLAYPAVFALEYALVELWRAWGVSPSALIGHSLGEYVAACVAGVFSLPDALQLVVGRARLIEAQGEGAMLAVPLPEAEVARYTDAGVCVAAVNGPGTCVLSGTEEAVARVERLLDEDDLVHRRLPTRFAYHSPMMDPVIEPYRELVRQVELRAPAIPLVSNVTGTWITDSEATDPDYWCRHLRATVRFADGVGTLWSVPGIALLEVGPARTLTPDAFQHPAAPATGRVVLPSLPGAQGRRSDRASLLSALAQLWLSGRSEARDSSCRGRRTVLPTYPFETAVYRIGHGPSMSATASGGDRGSQWLQQASWRRSVPAVAAPAIPQRGVSWLVFADEAGVGRRIASELAATGATVCTVSYAAQWQEDGDDYWLDPADPGHYSRLAESLRRRNGIPDRVLHCWGIGTDSVRSPERVDLTRLLNRSVGSLFRWAAACGEELAAGPARWDVLSTGVCAVLGDEPLCPPKAAVQDACTALRDAYPALEVPHTDLAVGDLASVPAVVERILAVLAAPASTSSTSLRGRHRWERVLLPAAARPTTVPEAKPGEVFLVVGGLRPAGLQVARTLAVRPDVKLVLLDEVKPPPTVTGTGSEAAVQTLESLGAEVMTVTADVTDSEQMHHAKAGILRRFGPVDGVVYCVRTEVPADTAFHGLESAIRGAYTLEQTLADQPLSLALVCSSHSGPAGAPGPAAGSALGAFALATDRSGPGWTSVSWEARTSTAPSVANGRQEMGEPLPGVRDVLSLLLAGAPRSQALFTGASRERDTATGSVGPHTAEQGTMSHGGGQS